MQECKILSFSYDHYKDTNLVYSHKQNTDGIFVYEWHGYEKEVNKYLALGWKIVGTTFTGSSLYIILAR